MRGTYGSSIGGRPSDNVGPAGAANVTRRAQPLERQASSGEGVVSDQPQTWHYGLVARWWAEFNAADPDELAFYRAFVERDGQPALDLACGTGRLLLPLLRAGLDVDGCDLSPDMLALCRERGERDGLAPRLYAQAMHALDLPRRYRTIFICGGFGLGGTREQDSETLRRCHHYLAPGGTLVFDHHLPYEDTDEWPYWLSEHRQRLPQEWPTAGMRRQTPTGDDYELRSRLIDLDPLEQRLTRQIRASLRRAGQLVAEEEHTLRENLYFRNEILLLLAQAGFGDVTVRASYTEAAPTADNAMIVFIART
jgi:SAM-dependent methyltransferase